MCRLGTNVLGIVVPIKNGDEIIGILKCNINIQGPLTSVLREGDLRSINKIQIARTKGLIVAEKGVTPLSNSLAEEFIQLLQTKKEGAEFIERNNKKELVAFSSISTTMGSEKFGFGGSYESIDHIEGNKGESWHVVVSLNEASVIKEVNKTNWFLIMIGFIFIIVTSFIAQFFVKWVTKPLIKLTETAKKIGDGNFETKISIITNDEIGIMGKAFNDMVEKLKVTTVSMDYVNNIFKSMGEMLIVLNPDGTIRDLNQATLDVLKYSKNDLLGTNISTIIEEEDKKIFLESGLSDFIKKENVKGLEKKLRIKDGGYIPALFSSSVMRNEESQIEGIVCVASDITERKQTEERLLESKIKFRTLSQNIPGMIYRGRADWSTEMMTNTILVSGYSVDDFNSGKINWLDIIYLDDKEKVFKEGAKLAKEPKNIIQEYRIKDKEGHIRWVRDHKTSLFNNAQEFVGVDGIVFDISEHKQLEAQLLQSQKMDAIGQLAGGVAHDINNKLNIIGLTCEYLMSRFDTEKLEVPQLEDIMAAVKSSASITQQLLAFGRKQILRPQILDLNEKVEEIEKMLQRLIGENIEVTVIRKLDLGQVKIDPAQIDQVIMNLVLNARDAITDNGKIIIETANIDLDDDYCSKYPDVLPGPYVSLIISDNGPGIKKEILTHIFEPFFTTKEKDMGTGLGLSTVFGIIKQSGGSIYVYSEKEKGTTFKIYLPRITDELDIKPEVISSVPKKIGTETIFLVEDEGPLRKLVTSFLKNGGYGVIDAIDGEEGLEIGKNSDRPIDLILTDVILPKMNGKEMVDKLGKYHPNAKVIFISGYTQNTIAHHGVLDEGINFLEKPFTENDLLLKVREVLDKIES